MSHGARVEMQTAADVSSLPERAPVWIELLVRPEALFTSERAELSSRGTLFGILSLGLATILDRREKLESLSETGALVALVVVMGIFIGGSMQWVIGGALFRARIRLCGARGADRDVAGAIFGRTAVVVAVTGMAASLIEALPGHGPVNGWLHVAQLVVMAWSGFAGYRGVVAAFPVSRAKARVWFLLVPILILALLVALNRGGGLLIR